MGKNKMIAKSCPKCEMQVAVASKSCKCGHTFFSARRAADHLSTAGGDELRRRTARVRRAQPQFYDSQAYQKQKRRTPKKRSLSTSIDESYKSKDKESTTARGRRRRALRRAARDPPRGPAGGVATENVTPLRPTQLARATVILQEINRKMQAVVWHPPQS